MANQKLSKEELEQIEEIQKRTQAVKTELGQLGLAEIDLKNRKTNVEDYLIETQEIENSLVKSLEEKYGQGSGTLGSGAQLEGDGEEKWEVNQLLFADDTVLVADSKKKLEILVDELGTIYRRRKLKVNVPKSKVMRSARDGIVGEMNIVMDGEVVVVDVFKYWDQ